MKIIILYKISPKSKEEKIGRALQAVIQTKMDVKLVDMGERQAAERHYYEIMNEKPDLIVTINLAAFDLTSEVDVPVLNTFPCRMAHLLLGEDVLEEEVLEKPYNFSMFFYVETKHMQELLRKRCQELPHIRIMGRINWESPKEIGKFFQQILSDTRLAQ